jgi:hypothetical protein
VQHPIVHQLAPPIRVRRLDPSLSHENTAHPADVLRAEIKVFGGLVVVEATQRFAVAAAVVIVLIPSTAWAVVEVVRELARAFVALP